MILVGVMVGNINVNYYSFLSHFTLSNKKNLTLIKKCPTNNDASLYSVSFNNPIVASTIGRCLVRSDYGVLASVLHTIVAVFKVFWCV